MLFKVITNSDIYKRFDSSQPFWKIRRLQNQNKRQKLGYYEIENIDDKCILTLAVNPKEYLELFKDKKLNENEKGIKKGRVYLVLKISQTE